MDDSHFSTGDFGADEHRVDKPQSDGRGTHRLRGIFRNGTSLAPDLTLRSPPSADEGSGGETFDTLTRYFEEESWHFTTDKALRVLRMGIAARNADYSCVAFTRHDHIVVFVCILPANAPPDKRHAAAEFLTCANDGIAIGNFEMDFSDGQIRFRTSIDVEGGKLTTRMVRSLVGAALVTTDRHYPGLMSVLWGGCSPESAVARARNGD